MVHSLLENTSSVTITADACTESYMTLTGHFINENWELINIGLQTRHAPESHTAENLKTLFESAFTEWNLHEKSVTGVIDNARNITKAWQLLQKQSINCFAHTMNLAVRKGLSLVAMDNPLLKARKTVSHFHHSALHTKALRKQQEALSLPQLKLKMDVETRWNSTYDMIVSVLANKEAIAQVLINDKVYRDHILSPEDITILKEVKDILEPWKELTVMMSKENDATISLIAPSIYNLLHKQLQVQDYDSGFAAQMKNAMKEDLCKRYQDPEVKSALQLASLLDPRFKLLPFLSCEEKEAAHINLKNRVLQFHNKGVQISAIKKEKPTQCSITPLPNLNTEDEMIDGASVGIPKLEPHSPRASPPTKKKKENFFDNFYEKSPLDTENFEEQLKLYLSMEPVSSGEHVLSWWKKNEKRLPLGTNS